MSLRRRRPRDAPSAIAAAAAAEFALRGYDAAGMDRIAARAKVNKATIYYYFGSKQGLYVAILRQMFTAVGARLRTIADSTDSPRDKTDRWIEAVVDEASQRPWFPPIMLRELASGAPHLDPETLEMMNAVFFAVRDILAQGERAGVFRRVDPLLTHLTIMPAILIYFARQRAIAGRSRTGVAEPRAIDAFVAHMQESVRRMLEERS